MLVVKQDLLYLIKLKEWLHVLSWSQNLLLDGVFCYIFKYIYFLILISNNQDKKLLFYISRMKKQSKFSVKNTLLLADFLKQRKKFQLSFLLKVVLKSLMLRLNKSVIYNFKSYQMFILRWNNLLPSLNRFNFLFFKPSTILSYLKVKFFFVYFLFGTFKFFFKQRGFNFLKKKLPFLSFELSNLGEVFKFNLFKARQWRIVQVLKLQNFFKYTFFSAHLPLKKVSSGVLRIAKTKNLVYNFLIKRLAFYVFKRRCVLWNKYNLRKFGSLYLGWYLFAYYLKTHRRDKIVSDFLYRFLRKLRRGYLRDAIWLDFPFYWDYALRWHFDSYYYFDVTLKKEIYFIKYFYTFSVLQAESVTSFNFLFQIFKGLLINSRDSFFLHRRKYKTKFNLKKFLLFWKKKFIKIFLFNMFLNKVLLTIDSDFLTKELPKLLICSTFDVKNSMFFSSSNRVGLEFIKMSFDKLLSDYKNGLVYSRRNLIMSELHEILMLLQVVSDYKVGDSYLNSLIELNQRLTFWLSEKTLWFNEISKILNLRYYKNLDLYCLKIGMVKISKLRRSWASWRLFKSNIFSFRRGKPIKLFFKFNRFLLRYYNFFYNYKFNLLKKKNLRGFIGLLECKVEVLIYRLGFVTDIISAQNYVRDYGVLVNDFNIKYSHYIVKVGSIIRASRDIWGRLLWRLNYGTSAYFRNLMPYIETSYRLYGCCLIRLPFVNELHARTLSATTKKPFMKWLFWLS